ncbi:MAG: thiol-disulfide oxidoreductase DCC family protein [Phycisphaerales bacterium]
MPSAAPQPRMTLYIDGACGMCSREANLMVRLDQGRGFIAFDDINRPDFDPASLGRSAHDVHTRIHAKLDDGRVIEGLEVFRRAYALIGRGWLLAPTGWPILRPIFEALYRLFARHRRRISRLFFANACPMPPPPSAMLRARDSA